MPFILEPGEERFYSLSKDKHLPLDKRPLFVCSAATGRLQKKHAVKAAAYDEAEKAYLACAGGASEQIAARMKLRTILIDMANVGVVGHKNFTVDGRPAESLDEVYDELDDGDLFTVAVYWPAAFRLTEDDRKNFCSPSQSDAEKSAGNASAGNVQTNQP